MANNFMSQDPKFAPVQTVAELKSVGPLKLAPEKSATP